MADADARKGRELDEQLAQAAARIDPVLEQLFPRQGGDVLSEAVWYHMEGGGKRIRPAICLLACEQLGGRPDDALPFAAAVEILHNMLLVHDDLEDGDTVRRNRQALWVRYGVGHAVNVGDYMLAVACRAVLSSPVPDATRVRLADAFADAYASTCRGQALDMSDRGREDLTVDDYLRMVTLKTGRYLALGMVGGAIVAGLEPEAVRPIEELGESMGPAFQIRDDAIDLTAGKGRGGVVGNDVREGKPSILYAHALGAASAPDRRRLVEIMRRDRAETTDDDVAWVRDLYERCGSLEFAARTADELVQRAYASIERIPVADREFFGQLARYMADRAT
ncbi:MAG: polyprenyl synthetase family protein [Candidatus Brocadiaceae bacterium]|nr:polyprenyl synthetase family protein [Candidatus Brocadiaceae bacterium]